MKRDDLKLRFECNEDWDAMSGDDRARHCGKCDQTVHDLSAMSREEAESLLGERKQGRLCVRYAVSSEGQVQFRPSSRWTALVAAAGLAVPLAAAAVVHQGAPPTDAPPSAEEGPLPGAAALALDAHSRLQSLVDDAVATAQRATPQGLTGTTGSNGVVVTLPGQKPPVLAPDDPQRLTQIGPAPHAPMHMMGAVAMPHHPAEVKMGKIAAPPPSRVLMGDVMQ
jgi:hypothetical protein